MKGLGSFHFLFLAVFAGTVIYGQNPESDGMKACKEADRIFDIGKQIKWDNREEMFAVSRQGSEEKYHRAAFYYLCAKLLPKTVGSSLTLLRNQMYIYSADDPVTTSFIRRLIFDLNGHSAAPCKKGDEGLIGTPASLEDCERQHLRQCHTSADCRKHSNGYFSCRCRAGFTGSGFTCFEKRSQPGELSPSEKCQNKEGNGCHDNAECLWINGKAARCQCKHGYRGDGYNCQRQRQPIGKIGKRGDVAQPQECQGRFGKGCHKSADCAWASEGRVYCRCKANDTGNGFYCKSEQSESNVGPTGPTATQKQPTTQKQQNQQKTSQSGQAPSDQRGQGQTKPSGQKQRQPTNRRSSQGRQNGRNQGQNNGQGQRNGSNQRRQGGQRPQQRQPQRTQQTGPRQTQRQSNGQGSNQRQQRGQGQSKNQQGTQGRTNGRSQCEARNGRKCHRNAECVRGGGRWRCSCKSQYSGDGYTCSRCSNGHVWRRCVRTSPAICGRSSSGGCDPNNNCDCQQGFVRKSENDSTCVRKSDCR